MMASANELCVLIFISFKCQLKVLKCLLSLFAFVIKNYND